MFRKRSRAADRVTETVSETAAADRVTESVPETAETDDRTHRSRFRLVDETETIFFPEFEIPLGRCARHGPARSILSDSIEKSVSADWRSHLRQS